MRVKSSGTGKYLGVLVLPVNIEDYPIFTKVRFFFNWEKEEGNEVYKINLEESGDILGLISIERIPSEWGIHIRLLSVSRENMGKKRKYIGIAGKLITFVGKLAMQEYGNFAKDMDITPVALSHVLNGHREPKIEFLQRLMIHSALVYQCITPFKNTTWFQVCYLGKIHDAFSEESRWVVAEAQHVKLGEPMERYGNVLAKSRLKNDLLK